MNCVTGMMKWRRHLPQRYRDKVPYMMSEPNIVNTPPGPANTIAVRYHPAKKFDGILLPRVASHVLFAYREIPYRRRAQIQPGHRGYTRLSEPTDDERALLNIFVRVITAKGGTADPAKFEWTFMINTDQRMGNPLVSRCIYATC